MRSVLAALLIGGAPIALAVPPNVAVYSQAFNGYTRTRLPDKSFKPETYVFAEGRRDTRMADPSLDRLSFTDIAHTIAASLRSRGYVPSFDPKHTDQVIFVFWGMTLGTDSGQFSHGQETLLNTMNSVRGSITPEMGKAAFGTSERNLSDAGASQIEQALLMLELGNRERDEHNAKNAGLLGYREQLQRAMDIPWFGTVRDVAKEIEWDRYYVILIAIDYDTFVHKKGYKLLWESKMSIPADGNAFDANLAMMTTTASRYFGEDLHQLVRERMSEGTVKIGTPTVVEPAPTK